MNSIGQLLQRYPTRWALGGAAFCGVAAVEMAARTFYDISQLRMGGEQIQRDLSADLGGTIFYGLCATNVVPYSAVAGAGIFACYSISAYKGQRAYVVSKVFGETAELIRDWAIIPLWNKASAFCEGVWNHAIVPLSDFAWNQWNHVIVPIARAIRDLCAKIFSLVRLPEHPIWYGVAAMVVAIALHNGYLPPIHTEVAGIVRSISDYLGRPAAFLRSL